MQYGKYVQKANKEQDILRELSPTTTVVPAGSPEYRRYESKDCSVAFTLPLSLKKTQESTDSATFISPDGKQYLDLSCSPKLITPSLSKEASSSLSLKGDIIPLQRYTITQNDTPLTVVDFIISHPQEKNKIRIIVDTELLSLFQNSFEFL
jgi:hypothetical protein